METIDLKQKEQIKKSMNIEIDIYYAFSLHLQSGEILKFKDYGCMSRIDRYLREKYNLNSWDSYKYVKVFENGTEEKINLKNVYKKYHKYFKGIDN